jgi:hypothetical protein
LQEKKAETPYKEDLEMEKISAEIKQLTKPWWKKLSTYGTLLPIIIAALAVLQGIRSGYFDRQRQILEIRERQLALDVRDLESQRDSLNILIKIAQNIRNKSVLTVEELKHSRPVFVDQEYGEAYPEFLEIDWGFTDVYSTEHDIMVDYIVMPAWMVDKLILDQLADERYREIFESTISGR